ncbi:GAL4-like Zn2Cys6 binuclear cluster DNA-binding domain-containing protein [Histoplasma capsulatum var. duboisii H88]|uniref:GAL4-like Zn2Cys6 binuclear cluster DNA-binding domain-containing protein n=1 Tax=Ajellomyces capsulatus (strain H88) TaxID=544711 RepID=A0A8A1LUI5_AJEC8|nr:GAL4-like Zn2Cys6 binuclear cluster DNA-binding domain-containing protein [Histoplasma capsulatum var. duboisii H88]
MRQTHSNHCTRRCRRVRNDEVGSCCLSWRDVVHRELGGMGGAVCVLLGKGLAGAGQEIPGFDGDAAIAGVSSAGL